ncbi:lectin C-type domain protein [Oesophagostomum dentatum]|uniref:Lectin C-type domain protein n=1 Tax=Oesophagostomum dentatum TaxID=61180 RepID=A0A0B1THD7_OESDE|nr:lectin C-type domain protein [Oesophagostomum dentatum]
MYSLIANALVCPSGYTTGQDDICYRVFAQHSGYSDASFQCTSDGGRLASIHNVYTNNAIHDLARAANTLAWLGLRCADANPANCRWDDGQGAPYPYTAFYPGNPSGIGECVLMMVGGAADGQWISGDCNNMQIGFVCQVPAKAACGNYQEFNGSCFQAYNNLPLSYDAGEAYCQSECGNLVSIHSADENDFIYNLLGHTTNYARIGLKRSGNSYVWTDTTRFDYNNVGYSNPAFGDCIAMSLVDELVAHGEWISVACEQALPFVCKRDGDCLRSTTVAPPTPVTLAPPTCDGPTFMDTNGTFYSPGYPESYRNAKACYYVMTVAADQKVEIYFVDLQLSTGSNIQLFNSIADSIPFATMTVNTTARYFTSSTNVMKMTFVAGNDVAGINRWEAMFGPGTKGR